MQQIFTAISTLASLEDRRHRYDSIEEEKNLNGEKPGKL